MIYAQIKDNEIKNTIILNDSSLESLFLEGFDYLKRIDNLEEIPVKGSTYDPEEDTYTSPVEE